MRVPALAGPRALPYPAPMRTLRPISILAATLLSCGPEPAPAPEFEELCGTESPHRLFALEPEEIVSALGGVRRIEDRLLFVAGRGTEDDPLGLPISSEPNVHSTDLCGQDHVIAAEDIYGFLSELTPWPGALLGCRPDYGGDLYLLDPRGVVPPELVPDVGCRGWPSAHGLVRTEPTGDDVAKLLFFPYATRPTPAFEPAVLLLDDVVDRIRTNQVFADEVLSLTPAGELVRVSLPGGAVTVEQSDVESFHASSDGRWLLWEDARTLDDAHAADVFLRDRHTGVDTLVAHADLRNRWPSFGSDFVRISFGSDIGERFVWLPSLEISDVPAGWHTVHRIPDGRWLVSAGFPTTGPLALRDLVTGEQTLLTDMPGAAAVRDDFVDILHGADPNDLFGTGELWRFRYDGSEPQMVARRAGRFRPLADGRIVTVIDQDPTGYGRLIAVDPDTLAETLIDERVFTLTFGDIFGDETIVYQVDDGERSGVWAVKLAPRE